MLRESFPLENAKKLAVVDASSIVAIPSLARIKSSIADRDLALAGCFFVDLLSQKRHPSLGTREQRLSMVAKRLREYQGAVVQIDYLDVSPGHSGLRGVLVKDIAPPEKWSDILRRDEEQLEQHKADGAALVKHNIDRFCSAVDSISTADMRAIRAWAQTGHCLGVVADIAATWTAALLREEQDRPIAELVQIARSSNSARLTMLTMLESLRRIGLRGSPTSAKEEALVADYHDLHYALTSSFCGRLVSQDRWLNRLHATLRSAVKQLNAGHFAPTSRWMVHAGAGTRLS